MRLRPSITLFLYLFVLLPATVAAQAPVLLYTLASGLDEPDGVALDPTEEFVYIADKDNARVAKHTISGSFVTSWNPSGNPADVAVDAAGNVYVSVAGVVPNAWIKKYSPQGNYIRDIPPPPGNAVVYGTNVDVDALGRVYFFITGFAGCAVMDSAGAFINRIAVAGSTLRVDEDFGLWTVGLYQVRHYSSGGALLGTFGTQGTGPGQLADVRRMALGSDSLLYFPEYQTNRVQAFSRTGVFQFGWTSNSAYAIDTDASGRIYVTSHAGGAVTVYGDPVTYDLDVAPSDTLLTSGVIGGPFAGSRQYVVRNTGADTVSFAAAAEASWLELSGPSSGTLAPGDSSFVTVVAAAAANSLGLGTYTGSIQFQQTSPAPLPVVPPTRRYIRLTVTPPPIFLLTLSATPADSVFVSGYAGGPFAPSSTPYTITNSGADSVNYTVTESAPWMQITGPLSGRLAPAGVVPLTAAPTAAANALAPGRYVTSIDIEQSNPVPNQGATGLQRVYVLDVIPLPPSALTLLGGDLASAGPVGGPFTPTAATYRITTNSVAPVSFATSTTAGWLGVDSGGSGSVTAGDTASVVIGLAPPATALPAAVHTGLIVFSQTAPQALPVTRNAYLTVGNVPLLEVTQVIPAAGITTAFAGGTPDTVLLTGTLLAMETTITFGDRPATVLWASSGADSLRVLLPWQPPGVDCVGASSLPVVLTARNGPFQDTAPFTYTIVTYQVPEQYPTIQAAVNASRPGVCVSVAPGDYRENVIIGSGISGITLGTRTLDLGETTIMGGDDFTPSLPAVLFDGSGADVVMTGFQILLGNSGVVIRNGAAPAIVRNYINNNFSSGNGGGVLVEAGCSPLLQGNRIDLNTAAGHGGGLAVLAGTPVLDDNNFNLNQAGQNGGGMYIDGQGGIDLGDLRLYGNFAEEAGGGAWIRTAADVSATRFDLVENAAGGSGGGLFALSDSQSVSLDSLSVRGNTALGQGGGLYAQAGLGSVSLIHSSVTQNVAQFEGGGLHCGSGTDLLARENLFNANRSDSSNAGGVYVSAGAVVDFAVNVLKDNAAFSCGSRGGGMLISDFSTGRVDSNLVVGNDGWIGGALAFGRKCRITARRNVVAHNAVSGSLCRLSERAQGSETLSDDSDTSSVAPAIFVDDSGVNLINNTIHGNVQVGGPPHGGGIHGRRTGTFAPDWINNILSSNSGWGVHAAGVNSAAIIDYNLGHANTLGDFSPTIHIPGEVPFTNNLSGDPLYINPGMATLDFHLSQVTSPAVDAGIGLDDPDNTPTDIGAFYFDQLNSGVPGPRPLSGPLRVLTVWPNPFHREVTVEVLVPREIPVTVDVFDIAGRRMMSRDLELQAGHHDLTWDGTKANGEPAASGIYFCRIRSGGWSHVDKLVLAR